MEFTRILNGLQAGGGPAASLFLAGVVLMLVGFGFKLGLVPFHLWVPDVYQGAPTPVTAFIATVSKGAVFAVMLRFFLAIKIQQWPFLLSLFAVIAVATMFVGNLLALRQDNLKRLLGYSSIAHMGYVLVAFLAGGSLGARAVTFYFLAYFTTVLGAFGILIILSDSNRDFQHLESCQGLAFRRPYLSAIFSMMLFSLAGIPLTAGFMGKFYLLGAGVGRQLYVLVLVLVANSVISLFYYLRVIVALFTDSPEDQPAASPRSGHGVLPSSCSFMARTALGVLVFLLFWIGTYPAPFAAWIDSATAGLK